LLDRSSSASQGSPARDKAAGLLQAPGRNRPEAADAPRQIATRAIKVKGGFFRIFLLVDHHAKEICRWRVMDFRDSECLLKNPALNRNQEPTFPGFRAVKT
jgi:hypothetical protein